MPTTAREEAGTMAETRTDDAKTDEAAEERLARAWEQARNLSVYRKIALIEYIEFLLWQDDDDDVWEPDEEEEEAVQAWLDGEREPGIPWEEVKRKSRELGDRVLD